MSDSDPKAEAAEPEDGKPTAAEKAAAKADEKGGPDRDAPESPAIDTDEDASRDGPDSVPSLGIVGDDSPHDSLPIPEVPPSGRSGKRGKAARLDDAAPSAEEAEEVRRPGKGEVEMVYLGLADVIEVGDYRFRPGQPVIVRSEVVEELLTMPNEQFAQVEE